MIGWSFFKEYYTFGISLAIGFYTMLRTGELLGLRSHHMMTASKQRQVLISLGLTKGGKRQGAAESVILGFEPVVGLVKRWKQVASTTTPLAKSPAQWRNLFNECLKSLGIQKYGFRPYSLRRGGATFWFSKHQSFDRILVQGRWHTQKSARIYLNEGLAVLAGMKIPATEPTILSFRNIYQQNTQHPTFSTLEPPATAGRAGGSGRTKKGNKRASKSACERSNTL